MEAECAFNLLIAEVNSGQDRFIEQDVYAGSLIGMSECTHIGSIFGVPTIYVCTTKKNSSSAGTENKVGPRTASAGYATQC